MKKRLLAVLMTSAMAVTLFAGCGTPGSSDSDSGSSDGKVFRYSTRTEPTTLDPTKGNCIPDNEIQHAITEGLVRNTGGEVTEGVAESWEVSEDGLTYTFHLRDDAKWSDGEPITAQDFVYSWQRLLNPETAAPYAFIGEYIKNGLAVETGEMNPSELAVSAPDDQTFVVTLEHPTAYFLSLIGSSGQFAPLRQDVVEEYGTDFAADAESNVYSGPYVLTSSENQEWVFEPNENYWNADAINLDQVVLTYVSNQDTALAMYEDGELDYVEIPSASADTYEGQDNIFRNGNVDYFYFNLDCGNPAMANTNFRLALNYALDRNTYNTLVNNDLFAPSTGLAFSGLADADSTWSENSDLQGYPLDGDTDQAVEYLNTALSELGMSSASDITVTITTTDSDSAKKQAEVVQEMWTTALGINVEINQVTYAEMLTRQGNGDFEIGWGGWGADYDDAYSYLELFKSDSAYNYSNYANEEVDALLNASQTETDAAARSEMLHQVEQILVDEAAFLPQAEREIHYLIDDDVQGVEFFHCAINIDWVYADIAAE
ncbi:oligopeptide ABC transporter substrate-binding protein Opp1A [Candidatus Bariatricus faecipullorum]